jgi:hypothetical protein
MDVRESGFLPMQCLGDSHGNYEILKDNSTKYKRKLRCVACAKEASIAYGSFFYEAKAHIKTWFNILATSFYDKLFFNDQKYLPGMTSATARYMNNSVNILIQIDFTNDPVRFTGVKYVMMSRDITMGNGVTAKLVGIRSNATKEILFYLSESATNFCPSELIVFLSGKQFPFGWVIYTEPSLFQEISQLHNFDALRFLSADNTCSDSLAELKDMLGCFCRHKTHKTYAYLASSCSRVEFIAAGRHPLRLFRDLFYHKLIPVSKSGDNNNNNDNNENDATDNNGNHENNDETKNDSLGIGEN